MAQRAISVRAGLIHHIEGQVWVEGRLLDPDSTRLQTLAVGEALKTGRGRSELVLAPGRFVRSDRDTEIELIGDDPDAAEVRLVSGAVIVDWTNVFQDGEAILHTESGAVRIRKAGRYRVDARDGLTAELRVFDGKALFEADQLRAAVKKKRLLSLDASSTKPSKFDVEDLDSFDRWNARRARVTARQSRSGRRRGRAGGDPGLGRGRRGRGGGLPDASRRGGGGGLGGGGRGRSPL